MLYQEDTDLLNILNNPYLKALYMKFGGTIPFLENNNQNKESKSAIFVGGATIDEFINELERRLNKPYTVRKNIVEPKAVESEESKLGVVRKKIQRTLSNLENTETELFGITTSLDDVEIPDYHMIVKGGDNKTELFNKIQKFIIFIKKIFYSNPTVLKLNCLNIDNFIILYDYIKDDNKDVHNCMEGFISFATIDIYDIENLHKQNKSNTETIKYIEVCNHIQNYIKDSKKIDEKYKIYIEKYKKNSNNVFNNDNGTYIHTLDFLKVMTTIKNENQLEKLLNNIPKLEQIMINFMTIKLDEYNSIIECFFVKDEENIFSPLKNRLNEIIKDQNEKNVVTYLKLSNQNQTINNGYNRKRFAIEYTLNEPKLMKVKYNYSNKNINDGDITDNSTEEYIVGGLTNLFLPEQSNSQIATELQTIMNKAKQGNPIMMIGYGISGAGKTSTLIYLNQPNLSPDTKNGIVLHMSNNLGKNDNYNVLELTVNEFYHTCKNSPEIAGCNERAPMKFNFINGEWLLLNEGEINKEEIFPKTHLYRQAGKPINYENIKTLGECLVYIIDTDRLVNPTTNNPNSSRSHSVIELKFIPKTEEETNKIVYLYIGDFAGIENAFDCKKPEVLKKFMTIGEKVDENGNITQESIYKKKYIDWYNNEDKDSKYYKSLDQLEGGGRNTRKNKTRKNKGGITPQNNSTYKTKTSRNTSKKTNAKPEIMINQQRLSGTPRNTSQETKELIPIKETDVLNEQTINGKKISPDFLNYPKDKIIDEQSAMNKYSDVQREINENQEIKKMNVKIENIKNMITLFDNIKLNDINIDQVNTEINDNFKKNILDNLFNVHPSIKGRDDRVETKDKIMFFDQKIKVSPQIKNISEGNTNTETQIKKIKNILEGNTNTEIQFIFNKIEYSNKKDVVTNKMENIYNVFLWYLNNINTLNTTPKQMDDMGFPSIYGIALKIKKMKEDIKYKGTMEKIEGMNYFNLYVDHISKEVNTGLNFSFNLFGKIYCRGHKSICKDGKDDHKNFEAKLSIIRWINGHIMFILFFSTDIIKIYLQNLLKEQEINLKTIIGEDDPSSLIENVNYLKYADFICKRRLEEGVYINDTLRKLHEDIKNITVVKNESTLYYSPDFAYDCLEDYCISQNDCFSIKRSSQTLDFSCPMIKWVYERLNTHKSYTEGTRSFAKDIIFSIFAVMNITKDINEPPPIPYVDINELKKHSDNFNPKYIFNKNANYINQHAIMVILYALHLTFQFLRYYGLNEILSSSTCVEIFGNSTNDNEITVQEIINHKQNLKELLNKGKKEYTIDNTYLEEIKNKYETNENIEFNKLKNLLETYKNGKEIDEIIYANFEETIQKIQKLADMIDSNNASSTIGTLEFIDQFSKMNTTSVLCKTDDKTYYTDLE